MRGNSMKNEKDVLILAIESSCDETAAAVVKNGRTVLSNVINTQIAIHTEYGGVVPEIASRKHIENIFYARFNYFILFFTLFLSIEVAIFLGDAIQAEYKLTILIILSFLGFIISAFICCTLLKIRKALEVTLKYRDRSSITAKLIREDLGERKKGWNRYFCSANYILSFTIPLLCSLFMLLIGGLLICCKYMHIELFVLTKCP